MPTTKEHDFIIDGRPYKVELIRCDKGLPFLVKVNDKLFEAKFVSEFERAKPFSIEVHGKRYEVELGKIDEGSPFSIKVNSVPFQVELGTVGRIAPRTPESPPLKAIQKPLERMVEEGAVFAPMTGKIISVRVQKGDSVKVGDVLCVLEAMKMENEIIAQKAGVVQEVMVSEGMSVNEGEPLIVVK